MLQTLLAILITITIGGVGCTDQTKVEVDTNKPVIEEVETETEETEEVDDNFDKLLSELNEKYSDALYGTISYDGYNFIVRSNNDMAYYEDESKQKELLAISKEIYDIVDEADPDQTYYMFSTSDYGIVAITKIEGVYFTTCFDRTINDIITYIK